MITRKWLYSYRMLTARLHEGMSAPTNLVAGFSVGSVPAQPQELSAKEELAERKPTMQALPIGGKT
jgi:hypothetical protein